jgi:hypothetical protein
MCQSVYADGKVLSNMGDLAAWLGIPVEELSFHHDYGENVADNPKCCLCPVEIAYTLDRFKIWHRRDIDGDSMVTIAMRST